MGMSSKTIQARIIGEICKWKCEVDTLNKQKTESKSSVTQAAFNLQHISQTSVGGLKLQELGRSLKIKSACLQMCGGYPKWKCLQS